MIPFIGTTLGAGCVLLMKGEKLNRTVESVLSGFAAGVMVAASVWSLLDPSMELSAHMGRLSFVPAVIGLLLGAFFLQLLDKITPHMHIDSSVEGPKSRLKGSTMMVLAVTLHNIPEGMAMGVVYAGWIAGNTRISLAGCLVLATGLALQNAPEGAIVSMPLRSRGMSRRKAFLYGMFSGAVEPVAAVITIFLTTQILAVLPYLLSFAAGTMIFVVIEELVPDMARGEHSNAGSLAFMLGFCLMLALDVALG